MRKIERARIEGLVTYLIDTIKPIVDADPPVVRLIRCNVRLDELMTRKMQLCVSVDSYPEIQLYHHDKSQTKNYRVCPRQ